MFLSYGDLLYVGRFRAIVCRISNSLNIKMLSLFMLLITQLAPVLSGPITHGNRARREVCLTFDACQTAKPAGYDARIVAILERKHIPATFMLGGRWMETHPEATRHLAANPLFEIGNHSYIHPHMRGLSSERVDSELEKTQDVMYKLTNKQGNLFRPPYGEYDDAVLARASNLGLRTITWEVVSGDPDPNVHASSMVREVVRRVRPGSIVIMHVNGRGWHTTEALPGIIAGLERRGFRFVTVDEALR